MHFPILFSFIDLSNVDEASHHRQNAALVGCKELLNELKGTLPVLFLSLRERPDNI